MTDERDPLVYPAKGDVIKLQRYASWDIVKVTSLNPCRGCQVEVTLEKQVSRDIKYGGLDTYRGKGLTLWQWRALVAGGTVVRRGDT